MTAENELNEFEDMIDRLKDCATSYPHQKRIYGGFQKDSRSAVCLNSIKFFRSVALVKAPP